MTNDKQRFVLYEYLLYFWNKKLFFCIIPPIIALTALLSVHLILNDAKYTGKALVFTGRVNLKDLTNPDNIIAKFPNIKSNVDIDVTEEKYVKITVKGNDKTKVQNDLHYIVAHYNQQLQDHSQNRLDVTMEQMKEYNDLIKKIRSVIEDTDEKIGTTVTDTNVINSQSELLVTLTDLTKKVNNMKSDLIFYEKPSVLSETVALSKSYVKEAVASGLVLGIFLTFMLLTLMKYVSDARRYYQ
ncbi:hypothetical protein AT864_02655 [Anoxybacillus sp. P3H1B]|uniref:lipopolysaccharide biosynthesis protein n=1 Tax=Anoxybacillus sp. P3H1B TaxID=1769293 RepID=UPI0007999304|nr:lipopolysaccharide biosynthesis protein [Anoxybacillus sp. P3H1B]KXG08971.1 hypothetical protein AT864_02655 [Anoxybacillus sp. P3H1B]